MSAASDPYGYSGAVDDMLRQRDRDAIADMLSERDHHDSGEADLMDRAMSGYYDEDMSA